MAGKTNRQPMDTPERDRESMNWASALESVLCESADKVPKGWVTTKEFSEIIKLSAAQANRNMRLLISKGKAETKKFNIKCGTTVRPVPHYRLK